MKPAITNREDGLEHALCTPHEDILSSGALEVARGEIEIKAAALERLFDGFRHDEENNWRRLTVYAQIARNAGRLPWEIVHACETMSEYRTRAEFARLVEVVRNAFATFDAPTLKQLAEQHGGITEDERPPMQFGLTDPAPRRLSQAAIQRRAKKMAKRQLSVTVPGYAKKKKRT